MPFKPIILLVAAAVAVSACGKSENPAASDAVTARPAVPVIAEVLTLDRQRVRIEAVGTSRARLSAELYASTSGEVEAVKFQPGQAVAAGDALVQLDADKERLALRMAELHLEDAERLYDRYQRSLGSGAVLPTEMDGARTAVELARVELERAKIALAERTIEAVFDGYVGLSDVDPGDRVDTSTQITTLDDRSSLFVSFEVPEAFINELKIDEDVRLEAWSNQALAVTGTVVDIGSRIDPANRTFVVRARVDNERDQLRPGMSFRVTIDVQGDLYAVVNETGLQWGADGAFVWTIEDGIANRVPVQIVQRREGRVLIDGDLDDGAIIVVEGTQNMRDGISVSHEIQQVATSRSKATGLD